MHEQWFLSVAPPGQPGTPLVENIGATWASISWTAPLMADSPISHYEVIAREMDGQGVATMTTPNAATFFNVTGLLPGTAYELTVVAVSEGGDVIARSPESSSVLLTTRFTGIHLIPVKQNYLYFLKKGLEGSGLHS